MAKLVEKIRILFEDTPELQTWEYHIRDTTTGQLVIESRSVNAPTAATAASEQAALKTEYPDLDVP